MSISRKLGAACSAVAMMSNIAYAQPATPTQPPGVVVGGSTATPGANGTTINQTFQSGPALTQAEAQAQQAQISAMNSAFSASGITPGAAAGTGAGTEEANLLDAAAINAAANEILHLPAFKDKAFFVYPGNSGFDLSAYTTFRFRLEALVKEFNDDDTVYKDAVSDARAALHPAPHRGNYDAQVENAEPGADAAASPSDFEVGGGYLAAAAKILSYFATSYSASGINVTAPDYMLAVAVASHAPNHSIIYTQFLANGAWKAIQDKLKPLATAVGNAQMDAATGNPLSDADKKAIADKDLSANIDNAVKKITADMPDYTAFAVSLFGGAQGNSAVAGNIASVVQEYAADTALKKGVDLLYVQIHNASGGLITKTNLWSTLGAMPLYASGGIVVSYALYGTGDAPGAKDAAALLLTSAVKEIGGDQDGDYYPMLAAGLFGVATPYHTIGNVPKAVWLDKRGICDQFNQSVLPGTTAGAWAAGLDDQTKEDAGKYCPR